MKLLERPVLTGGYCDGPNSPYCADCYTPLKIRTYKTPVTFTEGVAPVPTRKRTHIQILEDPEARPICELPTRPWRRRVAVYQLGLPAAGIVTWIAKVRFARMRQ